MREHQRGALDALYHLGHGVGLAGAGDAQQRLLVEPVLYPGGQGLDGLRLVAGGGIFTYDMESGMAPSKTH